jgi:hypothetical protein
MLAAAVATPGTRAGRDHDEEHPMDRDDASPDAAARPRRPLVLLVAAGAVVLLVAVGVAVGLTRGSGPEGAGAGSASPTAGASSPASTTTPGPDATPGQTADEELPASGPDAQEAPPVGLDASPVVVPGVTLRVKGITSIDGVASLAGEVSGPAVRAELELTNASGAPVDLGTTVVAVAYGAERVPANTLATGTSSFVGTVDTGSSATGVYVFAVPSDDQASLRLTVDYAVGVPVVVFEGSAS